MTTTNSIKGIKQLLTFLVGLLVMCPLLVPISAQPAPSNFRHYSMKHGLSNDGALSMLEDSRGFIWIGTWSGLNKFDGYKFTTYRENPVNSNSLRHDMINSLWEDRQERLWIGTAAGLDLFDLKTEKFTHLVLDSLIPEMMVRCLKERKNGTVWIGTDQGLFLADPWSLSITKPFEFTATEDEKEAWDIGETEDGSIWISTGRGLAKANEKTGEVTRYLYKPNDPYSRILEIHKALYIDGQDRIWLGGVLGIDLFDPDKKTFTRYIPDISQPNLRVDVLVISETIDGKLLVGSSLGLHIFDPASSRFEQIISPVVWSLLHDGQNQLWVGAFDGVYQLNQQSNKFEILHQLGSTRIFDVRVYSEDSRNNLWMVTHNPNQLFQLDPYSRNFKQYLYEPNNPGSYSGTPVRDIIPGKDGGVWLASFFGLERFHSQTNSFVHTPLPFTPTKLLIDSRNTLWIGGWTGIGTLDMKTHLFEPLSEFPRADVGSIIEDRQQKIWIGTINGGLYSFDLNSGQLDAFKNDPNDTGSLSHNQINHIMMDQEGTLWLGTNKGLNKIIIGADGQTRFINWNTNNSKLPHNQVFCVIDGQDGTLWMSCGNKISHFFPQEGIFRSYDHHDGLHGQGIYRGLRRQMGGIYLSSRTGIVVFHPDSLQDNEYIPPVAITGFSIRNTDLSVNGSNTDSSSLESPLFKAVPYTESIELTFKQNDFSLEFAALNFINPEGNQYKYRLEPYEKEWIETPASNRIARYTNISPGKYIFRVIGSNNDGLWNEEGQSLAIIVHPPLWATWWAYVLYGLCAVGLVLALRHYEKKRFILKEKTKSLEEIDRTKSEFFTNISHELRTPLTLIMGPLKVLQDGTYEGDQSTLLKMMSQNGKRLLRLVNQLLDLSKLDQGKMKLQLQDCHINELVWQVLANFDAACSLKNIELELHHSEDPVFSRVDEEKLRQVLNNLLSNAVKFTPEGGQIQVSVNRVEPGGQDLVKIIVRDSGIGIPKEELTHIFDRFYQVNNAHQDESEGTGIGLALVQKLVQLHEGTIEVESEPGWGSTFTVTLPLVIVVREPVMGKNGAGTGSILLTEPDPIVADQAATTNSLHPILLIAEDNAQMRQYIRTCLGSKYHYLEASDGIQGLKMAISSLPDLIICDVMMPVMDGFEFCRKALEQQATAHIPFIFLTARADHDSRIKGLGIGSNDYLIKPFDAEELNLKIRNHLDRINQFRRFFTKQLSIHGEIAEVQSLDEKFLHRAIGVVQDHIDNHEFTVNQFSHQVGMSQTQTYRKLIALTGQSPSFFIRSIRLKKAAQLIVQDYGNTSEIAYAVGFSNLSYFAKCFKEQFGISPSVYGKRSVRN